MNCPYCNFHFALFAANAAVIPDLTPVLCEDCGLVSLLEQATIRKITESELSALRESPVWNDVLAPLQQWIFKHNRAKNARNN